MSRFTRAKEHITGKLNSFLGRGDIASDADDTVSSSEDLTEENKSDAKKERGLKRLLSHARKKYLERGYDGSISISTLVGIFSIGVDCDVSFSESDSNGEDIDTQSEIDDPESAEEASRAESAAKSAMDTLLTKLEQRAKGWISTSYREDLSLSNGVSITIPFVGLASLSINFAVTVKSILSRLEREKLRALP
jgi:hypothetical protein